MSRRSAYEARTAERDDEREERLQAFAAVRDAALEKMRRFPYSRAEGMAADEVDGEPIGGYLDLRHLGETLDLQYGTVDGNHYRLIIPLVEQGIEAEYQSETPPEIMRQAAVLIPQLEDSKIRPLSREAT